VVFLTESATVKGVSVRGVKGEEGRVVGRMLAASRSVSYSEDGAG
jgi:hypothetical protein